MLSRIGRKKRKGTRTLHTAAGDRANPATAQWIQAASAAPSAGYGGQPPRLTYCRWAGCDTPVIIVELRAAQLTAVSPGFRRWSDCDVQAPVHYRGVVERTAAGAALIINDVLVATGQVDGGDSLWPELESCVVAAIELGQLGGCSLTLAEEFAGLAEAGRVWIAEMAVAGLAPQWSRQ